MFRCADYTRSGTARAGGEVTHSLQWSSEVHASDLALIYYKTPDGCKGGWTCAKHAPGGRGAVGRLRVKTADGGKAGWTCAKHAPGGREAVGRLRVNSRYYNPTDGRWTRRDPIGLVGGMNLYTFLKKCPVNATDIHGLRELEDSMIDIAGIIGSTWASYLTMIAEEQPNEVEYCGLICKSLNSESIVITTPKRGMSTTTVSACFPDASPCPRCYNKVGAYHSHTKKSKYGPLSNADHKYAMRENIPVYVGRYYTRIEVTYGSASSVREIIRFSLDDVIDSILSFL